MTAENFLPFRRSDVVTMCAEELPVSDRDGFAAFARMLSSLLHHRFHERIEALKDAYHPFHPEADTRTIRTLDPEARTAAQARVEEELTALARAANYIPMDLSEVEHALAGHSLLKLRLEIDTGDVDSLLLFRRGESERTRTEKVWFGLRRRDVSFTNYARVLVYAKFKEASHFKDVDLEKLPFRPGSVIVKLFQNVPRNDLEMIFPNVRIRMRLIDKLLIGVPAVISGIIVIVTKLFSTLALIALLILFLVGLEAKEPDISRTALISILLGLIAVGGYVIRQVGNFKNRKILFMKSLSENLYFRNLDNDAGVFHHLLDAAEEAEAIEAVLAYHFLRTADHPLTKSELDSRVEEWFASRWGERFDFEVDDGLRKLQEYGLVTSDGGAYAPVPIDEATRRMDQLWDDAFIYTEPATSHG
jgi:hypothetical protein